MRSLFRKSRLKSDSIGEATTQVSNRDYDPVDKPTTGEYAIQGAKDFLRVLEAVAEAVPIPGFVSAVKLAINIVKACEESHTTLEHAQELKSRIRTLLVVLVNQLKGKKAEEIPAKMLEDIEALKQVMEYIETQLKTITSQNPVLVIIYKGINEDKVRKCVARLDTSIEGFSLARDIEHTEMLGILEQQIAEFHTKQQRSLDNLQISMDGVTALLAECLPGPQGTSRAMIPPNTSIFYGRDVVVSSIIDVITGPSRQHVCLLGPGGMGKTCTSLAVMGRADVQAKFPDDLRVWVPCVKATAISIFLDTLHTSLGISTKSDNPLTDIVSDLKKLPPIVILLDNLETPWNVDESEVDRILRTLDQIPHVRLFITMRASTPPCNDIPWNHIDLQAVDAAAAREIYTSWHPQSRDDPDVPRLLTLIGHMPLAVMLMAKMAKVTHFSAVELMEEYTNRGPKILGQGFNADNSMDVCIGLSVNNTRMKAHSEALTLLCILSMLPIGTTLRMLVKLWARDLFNIMGALDVLKSSALVEEKGTILSVLPVIQRYILDPSRFPPGVRTSMIQKACAFLTEHASAPGDPKYQADATALSSEDGNLEAVLLTTTIPDPQVIRDGLLALARHQHKHRPRLEIIEHAKNLCSSIDDNILRGDVLYHYGTILYRMFQFPMAADLLHQAMDFFLAEHDDKKIVECRLQLAGTHRYLPITRAEKEKNLMDAQARCVGDGILTGRCFYELGNLHRCYSEYPAALAMLMKAEAMLTSDPFLHGRCCHKIAWCHYRMIGGYDSAYKYATSAFETLSILEDHLGCVYLLVDIGQLHSARGDHASSLESLFQCLEICKSLPISPFGFSLELMGLAWVKLSKVEDARRAFQEAAELYTINLKTDEDTTDDALSRVKFFLRRLNNPGLNPTSMEKIALEGRYSDDHIKRILAPSVFDATGVESRRVNG